MVSNKNDHTEEIGRRIQSGYRACRKVIQEKLKFESNRINRQTNIKVYKTIIRPVIMYAAETVYLTYTEKEKLKSFKKTVIIILTAKDLAARLLNHKIQEIVGGEDIVRMINSHRMKWYGHINRKRENTVIRNI